MYESYYISQLRVYSVATSHTLSFCSVFHQQVIFYTKDFHSFQAHFNSFLLASPGSASSTVPVGGDFPIPPIPSAPLFFPLFNSPSCFQTLSALSLWFHRSFNPLIFLPYFILPFVLSSSTPRFLKSSPVSSHLHTPPPLHSTTSLRCPIP